jgi:hypothetical protein
MLLAQLPVDCQPRAHPNHPNHYALAGLSTNWLSHCLGKPSIGMSALHT